MSIKQCIDIPRVHRNKWLSCALSDQILTEFRSSSELRLLNAGNDCRGQLLLILLWQGAGGFEGFFYCRGLGLIHLTSISWSRQTGQCRRTRHAT